MVVWSPLSADKKHPGVGAVTPGSYDEDVPLRHKAIPKLIKWIPKNINKDTQEMPQSRSGAFPRHQKMERWGTNKDKTNVTFETIDARTKQNCKLKRSVENNNNKNYWGVEGEGVWKGWGGLH